MKTTTFNVFITFTLLAFLAFAPLQFAFANNDDNSRGFFSSFRERQITNREQVKINLLQILSSEEESASPAVTTSTEYNTAELANITYQLTDIADRIESRMLILENQGTEVSTTSHTTLVLARTSLSDISLTLMSPEVDVAAITAELAIVRTQLQAIIAELKASL